jgi:hypothetical protein
MSLYSPTLVRMTASPGGGEVLVVLTHVNSWHDSVLARNL